ncbi:hypothetical protein OS493_022906 [Desmophyllum pertusum]|uniref:Uncharacterized protein n=1 Tax=Desmophyllum pertusum TaxID=174260 RepID=A0A9W9ZME5_9CNID|nr:hypothetical protein OS493_022906 [Desmophyllum pertusum]
MNLKAAQVYLRGGGNPCLTSTMHLVQHQQITKRNAQSGQGKIYITTTMQQTRKIRASQLHPQRDIPNAAQDYLKHTYQDEQFTPMWGDKIDQCHPTPKVNLQSATASTQNNDDDNDDDVFIVSSCSDINNNSTATTNKIPYQRFVPNDQFDNKARTAKKEEEKQASITTSGAPNPLKEDIEKSINLESR